jgi:hypothetical protein
MSFYGRFGRTKGNGTSLFLSQRLFGYIFVELWPFVLSTPHLGTVEANYGEFLTGVLNSLFGLRNDAIIKELQSFNSSAVEATKAWGTMRKDKKMPPFECLCESRQTRLPIKGYREVRPFLVS